MPTHLRLFLGVLGLIFLLSCSSSKSGNDTDILPDSDDSESIADNNTDSEEDSYFIDDYDEKPDHDTDSATPEEPDNEIFEETEPVNGYARCYDKIPAGDYDGLFADPMIESQIKQILGYDEDYELAEEDLEKVKEITLSVKDIRGVEKLVNLKSVKISTGKIYDYTPLSELKKLKKVVINTASMTCLDGSFSQLTNLETLEIRETKLKDVSPVEQLVNLTSLDLLENQIKFLPENISNLQQLEFLAFSHNNVQDINPLKSLTNLKKLFFHYNYVEDISPVKDLVNLTSLGGSFNKIKDLSPVTNLVNLTFYLEFHQNQIKEIPKDIINLKKLQELDLTYNEISNLPELKGLDSIVTVRLSYNDLNNDDFIKLNELETVRFLDVAFNKITNVPVMKNLKSLKELYLNYNSITDLSGFADNESFPALKSVYLGSNKISDAEALRERKGLNRLSIGKNCIQDLSPLEELNERGTYVSGMNDQLENCEDTTTLGDGE